MKEVQIKLSLSLFLFLSLDSHAIPVEEGSSSISLGQVLET